MKNQPLLSGLFSADSPADSDAIKQELLIQFLSWIIITNIAYYLILWAIYDVSLPNLIGRFILMAGLVVGIVLSKRGYSRTIWIIVPGFIHIFLTRAMLLNGVTTEILFTYTALLLFALIFLNARWLWFYFAVGFLTIICLLVAENLQIIPLAPSEGTQSFQQTLPLITLVRIAILLFLAMKMMDRRLTRLLTSEKKAQRLQTQLVDALESLTEAFALYDENDRLQLFNSNYQNFYDKTSDFIEVGVSYEALNRHANEHGQFDEIDGQSNDLSERQLNYHHNPEGFLIQKLSNGRFLRVSERKTASGGTVGVRTDITDQILAESVMSEREQMLNDLINSIDGIVWEANASNLKFTFVSAKTDKLLGYSIKEWLDQPNFWEDHIHPEDREKAISYCLSRTLDLQDHEFEYRMIGKDGRIVWIHDVVTVLSENGKPSKLRGIMVDITERKEAEMEIAFQKTLLEHELEASPDGILITAKNRRWLFYNSNLLALWELDSSKDDSFKSKGALEKAKVLVKDPDQFLADVEYLYTHPYEIGNHIIELKDGRIFERFSAPIVSKTGDYYGRVWSYRNMTERRLLEAQLNQAQKMEAIGQLTAGIAHDFNNILSVIELQSQIIQRTDDHSAKTKHRLKVIEQQVDRATNLIQQILDFSRQSVLSKEAIELTYFLTDFVNIFQRTMPENISVTLQAEVGNFVIDGDATRLQQVLMNLAVNARDAMPKGGSLSIKLDKLSVADQLNTPFSDMAFGEWACISFTDNGGGIPQKLLNHIFEPFFTTKSVGKGTGLGLAQVYGIVKQHGGYIDVQSIVSKGTTFLLFFPMLAQTHKQLPTVDENKLIRGKGEVILVVEDKFAIRNSLAELLTLLNYEIKTAENGTHALECLQENATDIDLVISDVVMPKMGGGDLFQLIKKQWPEIPTILITGHPLKQEMDAFMKKGLAGWMTKPPKIEELANLIATTLSS